MSNRIKIVGVGVVLVALIAVIGAYFYTHADTQTPDHALKSAGSALGSHDVAAFNRAVDVDRLLNSSYDGFVDGLIESDPSMSLEAREAITNFTQMLRLPIINSLKTALESYVETGAVTQEPSDDADNRLTATDIMERAGLSRLEFRAVDGITIDDHDPDRAVADMRFYQPETSSEFVFKVGLERDEESGWRVVRLDNFREFTEIVARTRREALDKYLEETAEINLRHDQTIREAEDKYGAILSLGSLGQDQTRFDLKVLLTEVVKKDWEVRKQELFSVDVPKAAEPLQNLRMRICELSIESAADYARWMEDKKGATAKSAEEKTRQVQVLQEEEKLLIARMTRQPSDR